MRETHDEMKNTTECSDKKGWRRVNTKRYSNLLPKDPIILLRLPQPCQTSICQTELTRPLLAQNYRSLL